ncbi:LOW QUALITY PROTEIN: hypothetical protein BC938DRAFT_481972 [Jimgerdemannia flammicorona]|uniref:Uncharacterized protein n=1 Tax=Jimgerdemannia flammicorona TaxID=994334 RepID=A0A433QEX9_9FUNG|nr:LOW QUALITY PROTEIN: hypothetical protein BC938DRAFT_481972 [Jimgerdemannia flammicorona]
MASVKYGYGVWVAWEWNKKKNHLRTPLRAIYISPYLVSYDDVGVVVRHVAGCGVAVVAAYVGAVVADVVLSGGGDDAVAAVENVGHFCGVGGERAAAAGVAVVDVAGDGAAVVAAVDGGDGAVGAVATVGGGAGPPVDSEKEDRVSIFQQSEKNLCLINP